MADGPVRHVPARGCGDAGWTVTGRGARADRGARPYRVQDEHDRQAGDGYTGPPVLQAAAAIGALLRGLIRAGGSWCPAGGRVAQAPAGDLLLAASPARGPLTGYVRRHVDHLCKTARSLFMPGGNAGDHVTRPRS